MPNRQEFKFSGNGVSAAYDDVLVPLLFEPWTESLMQRFAPIAGMRVVDVATGTGIVAQKVADRVGPNVRVTGTDISAEMLAVARKRCQKHSSFVSFVESAAAPLPVESVSTDVVFCQQGFQFFPDKRAAAAEMFRVLKRGGRAVVSAWRPLNRCTWFGAIHDALTRCDEGVIADMITVPFNHMPGDELVEHFRAAGFHGIELETPEADLVFEGGVEQAYQTVFATPIGPRLRALPDRKLAEFREAMLAEAEKMTVNGVTTGRMASILLVAERPL
jgi:ubiquinone/menaquinone biosynthesis C-methylase UbiE